jgi:hypothetical protein
MANNITQCLDEIVKCIVQRKSVDYGNKASVRRFNAAYDRIIKHARYIDLHYPDQIDAMMTLLYHDDFDVVLHVAPIILTLVNSTFTQKWEAIGVLKKLVADESLPKSDRLAYSASLENWEKRLRQMTDAESNGSVW